MPTKIVSTASNPQLGVINQADLTRIIQDFENFVEIKSTIAREFKKIDTVSIPVSIIDNLLNTLTPLERTSSEIKIKFGITLPNQKDCLDTTMDVSNHLTVILFLNVSGIDLRDQLNDFVITPAFKELSENGAEDGACCPVIRPPKQ